MNWDDLRLFLALSRSGSARSAGEALSLSHTTVARRVDQLEARLGTRLFDRSVNGYRLTGAGEAMIESALRVEDAILSAERKLHGQDAQLSGEVRLTTSDIIANHLLMDELVVFSRLYPQIDLTILTSYDVLDLGRREADIAVRSMGRNRMPPEDLVGRRLVTASSCYYASADYLAEHNPAVRDSGARWLGWDDDARYPEWVKSSPFPEVRAYGKFNNVLLQVQAARHGMGLAILPCFLGDTVTDLQRIPGCEPRANYDIWLLSHPDLRDTARLRTFRRFIADAFERKHDLLTGHRVRAT